MAITSEIIGTLGGKVEEIPVSASVSGSGNNETLHTLNIPAGETWLVAVVGEGTAGSTSGSSMTRIAIDDKRVPQSRGYFASSAVVSQSGDVVLESNSYGTSSFTGHVYTVKM